MKGTIFRSNTITSALFKNFAMMVGAPYLWETLAPFVWEIQENGLCEKESHHFGFSHPFTSRL
jgi:hypothetical protein